MTILADKTIKQLCTPPYRDHRIGVIVKECLHKPAQLRALINAEEERVWDIDDPDLPDNADGELETINQIRVEEDYEINNAGKPMIEPFVDHLVRVNENGDKIISYGLTSYGYDVRLAAEGVKVFTNANGGSVDPMKPDDKCFINGEIRETDKGLKYFILPPNSYALATTVEWFNIPRNVSVVCLGKSTYARSCAIVNVTPVEAGFSGEVVIEISNGSTLPVMIYLETGIAQFQFFHGDVPCEMSYADGNRKYQGKRGVTLSKV